MDLRQLPLLLPGYEIREPVEDCRIESFDLERGVAKLLLAFRTPPTAATSPHQATKVALYVDIEVARKIAAAGDAIVRTMARAQQQGNPGPDGMQTRADQGEFQSQVYTEMRRPPKHEK
jgi:hypothetical protein